MRYLEKGALWIAAVLAAAAGGCAGGTAPSGGGGSDGGTDGDTDPQSLVSIDVIPASVDLVVENGVPVEQSYMAIGHFQDGSAGDITSEVELEVSPGTIGVFDGEVLATSDTFGGAGEVIASLAGVSGTGEVTVHQHGVHLEEGVPDGAESMFEGSDDPSRAPELLYPLDGVLLPPNLADVRFQWDGGEGNDLWRLEMSGDFFEAEIYTSQPSFTPCDLLWEQASWGNAGLGPIEVRVSGTSAADSSTMGTSDGTEISFAEQAVQGGIYYWAASSTVESDYGIFRYDFGEPGQQAEQVFTTAQTGDRCVACHALSHDGERMALNYDGGDGPADIISVAAQESIVPAENAYYANFHTYSADDTYVLSVYQGIFTLRDGSSGAVVETLALDHVTYPDWSLDGSVVAFTRATRDTETIYSDWSFHGGQIELMTYDGPGAWGSPEILVPAEPDTNIYYPAISPDGDWVAFNKSSELGEYDGAGDSYSDDDARLWVVSIEGGEPIELANVNLEGELRTSWAKWCPEVQNYHGEPLMWLTVSSMRRYGFELASGELPQLWMAAFSPAVAEDGLDPTRAAFYLPFQDITTNNHIAQWTEVVVDYE
ncbi:MAG: hypothetical protein R6V85_04570 [Polyangia bacterium]